MRRGLTMGLALLLATTALDDRAMGQGQGGSPGTEGAAPAAAKPRSDGPNVGRSAGPDVRPTATPPVRINPKAAADPPPPSAPAKPKVVKAAPPAVDATVKAPPAKTAAASPSGFITRARCVQMIRNKYKFIYAATDWQTKIDLCVTTKGQTF